MKLAWALLYPTDLDVSRTSHLGIEGVSLTIGAAKQKRSANIRFSRALQLGRINIRFLDSSRYTRATSPAPISLSLKSGNVSLFPATVGESCLGIVQFSGCRKSRIRFGLSAYA